MGLEYARQLAAEDCGLALVSNRPEELAAAAATLSSEFGVKVITLDIDLCAPGAAGKVLEWCDEEGVAPDILINNAGMFFMHYLGPENLAKASAMVDLHVKAVTELCVLFGARMKESGAGRILNVASMTAWIPAPGIAVYSASKAYLVSFGKAFHMNCGPTGSRSQPSARRQSIPGSMALVNGSAGGCVVSAFFAALNGWCEGPFGV